jgi:hypothetical protein
VNCSNVDFSFSNFSMSEIPAAANIPAFEDAVLRAKEVTNVAPQRSLIDQSTIGESLEPIQRLRFTIAQSFSPNSARDGRAELGLTSYATKAQFFSHFFVGCV